MAGKAPSHNLCVRERSDDPKAPFAVVGVGWVNDNGNVSLRLNPGASISWRDNLVMYLFKRKNKLNADGKEINEPFYTPSDYKEMGQ
jgi:hypothetical protein